MATVRTLIGNVKGEKGDPGVSPNIIDNLTSTSTTDALSANQGRVLNEKIVGLIESGSNENGDYIKFADGTMICTLDITVTDQAIDKSYGSSGLYTGNRTWTFPFEFIEAPNVSCSRFTWGTGASWGTSGSSTNTRVTLFGIDALSRASGTETKISAIAIGKWK